jgi:putative peptide zinc metalloprotease protein
MISYSVVSGGEPAKDATALTFGTGAAPVAEVPPLPDRPCLVPGVEFLGQYQGSGFATPQWLLRRPDRQVVQVSTLLYLVAEYANGELTRHDIASRVSERYGRTVSADNVAYLLDRKLAPLGLTDVPFDHDPSGASAPRANPVLALRARRPLIPEAGVAVIARAFAPLFHGFVVAAVLGALVALDGWLFGVQGLGAALTGVLANPALILVVLALALASMVFHEFGHAAACRYGGARPGVIGGGLYLLWPALYTDVTDTYRTNRIGRLRTDLGGVYFNAVFALGVATAYGFTSSGPLLVAILVIHLEIFQQLLPVVRLDGYFVLTDLVGVPDLLGRVRPTLLSLAPRRWRDPAVQPLKPHIRVIVAGWVFVVVPLLAMNLVWLVVISPRLVTVAAHSAQTQWTTILSAVAHRNALTAIVAMVEMLTLLLPITGILLLFTVLIRRMAHAMAGVVARISRQERMDD